MKTLYEAIGRSDSRATGLIKHLSAFGITEWGQLTKSQLYDFRDYLLTKVCSSSAKTYFARLKVILKRYEDDGIIPCKDFAEILKAKEEKPQKIYLNNRDLWAFETVEPRTSIEKLVKSLFLLECYTGARCSDVMNFTDENIVGNTLTYVSKKTRIQATIPLKPCVPALIKQVETEGREISTASYNRALQRLCKRAGVNEKVKVFKGGRHLNGEKWRYVSSHTGRISFATNLSEAQTELTTIAQMLGHTDVSMTQRYIVKKTINLSPLALQYFA